MAWTRTILGTGVSSSLNSPLGPFTHLTLTDATAQLLLNPGAISFPLVTDTVALLAASQALTNKTLTAPAISDPTLSGTLIGTYTVGGTMTIAQILLADADATRAIGAPATGWQRIYLRGTGGVLRYDDTTIMGIREKAGSGAGDYTTTSLAYVDADATNLALTVTVPLGWNMRITAMATTKVNAQAQFGLAITDGTTLLRETVYDEAQISFRNSTSVQHTFIGDNASHTFKMRFHSDGTNTATILNGTTSIAPTLEFILMPSN